MQTEGGRKSGFGLGTGRRAREVSSTPNWNMSAIPSTKLLLRLCVDCVNLAQMRPGGGHCLHNKRGHVRFRFHNARQIPAEHVDEEENTSRKTSSRHVFALLPDQTMPPCLSSAPVPGWITANIQLQLPETAAVRTKGVGLRVKGRFFRGVWRRPSQNILYQPEPVLYSYSRLSGLN